MSDEVNLTLTIASKTISGWQSVRVSRGIERCPSEFDIEMTELFPGAGVAVVTPGDPCTISLGADLVITGFVDRYEPSISPTRHSVRVRGRGKCQDLVDCSANLPSNQISGVNALDLASRLAAPYNVTVSQVGDPGPPIPQFNFMIGETAWEVIEKVARFSAFLAYEQPDGNLVLSRIGTVAAASGFTQGVNVEQATHIFAVDQRFNEYRTFAMAMNMAPEIGANIAIGSASDPIIRATRKKFLVAEQGAGGYAANISIQRGLWEAARRKGRGYALHVQTDGWRDQAGTLWTPNTLVPLSIPALKVDKQSWVIAEVSYERSSRGTHAHLSLMPPDAFLPQPILLAPYYPDIPQLTRGFLGNLLSRGTGP